MTRVPDPFARGRFPVGVRTIEAHDAARDRLFPCELWYPASAPHSGQDLDPSFQDVLTPAAGESPRAQTAVRDASAHPGTHPLVLFSHCSGAHRRQSTFLATHLSSHGYVVAAVDHSEVVAPQLRRKDGETPDAKALRIRAWIANRVPDVRFLLDYLLGTSTLGAEAQVDPGRIGIVGHSFGGWTALAAPEVEPRIRAVVALAPAGSSNPGPNIIPATLTFAWSRDVPTLYIVAEDDSALPLAGMIELLERTRSAAHMVILRKADHGHFFDEFEQRAGQCPSEDAHVLVRGLSLGHLNATLRSKAPEPAGWIDGALRELERRGIAAAEHPSLSRPAART